MNSKTIQNKNHKYQSLKNEEDDDEDEEEEEEAKKNLFSSYYSDTSEGKNIKEVLNPTYNVNSYLALNQNSNDLNMNDNNANNNNRQEKNNCSDSNRRNSFLDIITRTIRNLMSQNADHTNRHNYIDNGGGGGGGAHTGTEGTVKNKRVLFNKQKEACLIENNQFKIDEINMNKEKNQVRFVLNMPISYFKPEEIELFKSNKLGNRSASVSNIDTDCNYKNENIRKSRIDSVKKKNGRHIKCHQSEQNLFDLNRQELSNDWTNKNKFKKNTYNSNNDYSLHSLSSYNQLNRQFNDEENKHRSTNLNCTLYFVFLGILINPLAGLVSLYFAIKSKKSNLNWQESSRLSRIARQWSVCGMILSFLLVYLPILFLIFGNELLSIYQVNSTNLTDSKRSLFIMDQPLQTTQLASSSRSSTLTRIVKTIAEPSTPKNYDRLSILIDHDLFKSLKLNTDLFQKLKLSNESLILNPT